MYGRLGGLLIGDCRWRCGQSTVSEAGHGVEDALIVPVGFGGGDDLDGLLALLADRLTGLWGGVSFALQDGPRRTPGRDQSFSSHEGIESVKGIVGSIFKLAVKKPTTRSLPISAVAGATALATTFALLSLASAGAQAGATISCDKTTIAVGSGSAGEAHCQLAGFAPSEAIVITSTSPTFTGATVGPPVGPNGSGPGTVFSVCRAPFDQPGASFTDTFTGQTSHRSASASFTYVANPACVPPSTSARPARAVHAQPHFTG